MRICSIFSDHVQELSIWYRWLVCFIGKLKETTTVMNYKKLQTAVMSYKCLSISSQQELHSYLKNMFKLSKKNTSKLCITGPLWGESTGEQWIPHTKGQYCRMYYLIMMILWYFGEMEIGSYNRGYMGGSVQGWPTLICPQWCIVWSN